jgi:serine/threonine protein kinase
VLQTERELLRNEIAVLKLVRHASIVRLEAVFETNHTMYIVLEKVCGGELYSRIVGRQRFSEFEARALAKPLIEAVAFIHAMGVVHRDIKVGAAAAVHIVLVVSAALASLSLLLLLLLRWC